MAKLAGFVVLSLILFSAMLTGGCTKMPIPLKNEKGGMAAKSIAQNNTRNNVIDNKVEVKFLAYNTGWDEVIRSFEGVNPGIKVKIEIIGRQNCKEEYDKALTSGDGPDVIVFDSSFFNEYTVEGILQDLLKEPICAGKYQQDFLGWSSGMSLNNKHLLSLTLYTNPLITMYRADVMEQYGFPSDPQEFGKFLERYDNIVAVAGKLKEQGKFIFQQQTDITDVVGASLGLVNEKLNYTRYSNKYSLALNIAREGHKYGWEAMASFYEEKGKQAIKEDRLVMVCNASSYDIDKLKEYVPEQKGKWRITRSPLGVYSWGSDIRISINEQSTKKSGAWRLIEYIFAKKHSDGLNSFCVPGYIPSQNFVENKNKQDDFFGGQVIYPVLKDIASKMHQYKLTPINEKVKEMYLKSVMDIVRSNENIDQAIAKARRKIDDALLQEKRDYIK